MKDWASRLFHQTLRACACVTAIFLLNGPSELSLAQGPNGNVPSLIALEKYLNEECDVTTRKSETCGVTRLIPHKNDAVLKQSLLQILRRESDQETLQMAEKVVANQGEVFQGVSRRASPGTATSTMTKEVYSQRRLELILRIYSEKAALGLATINPEEATRLLAGAEEKGDQVLAQMLRFALLHHP